MKLCNGSLPMAALAGRGQQRRRRRRCGVDEKVRDRLCASPGDTYMSILQTGKDADSPLLAQAPQVIGDVCRASSLSRRRIVPDTLRVKHIPIVSQDPPKCRELAVDHPPLEIIPGTKVLLAIATLNLASGF